MGLQAKVIQSAPIGYFRTFVQPKGGRRREVTFFRGAATKVGAIRTADPFTDISLTLTFPQVTIFDTMGHGDLSWMQPDANIDVLWQNVGQYKYDWSFEGFLVNPNYVSNETENYVSWEVRGALLQLDNYLAQPQFPSQPIPYETLIARAFDASRHPANIGPFHIEWPTNPIYGNMPLHSQELPLRDEPRSEPDPSDPRFVVTPTPKPTPDASTPVTGGNTMLQTFPNAKYPSDILDLRYWKVTWPDGSEKKGLIGVSNKYMKVNSAKNGVELYCEKSGHTSGSTYSRCEYREMKLGGSQEAYWDSRTGTHVMETTVTVNDLPDKRKKVVVAQVHGSKGADDDDIIMVALDGSSLVAEAEDGSRKWTLDSNLKTGDAFFIRITCTPSGITVRYENASANKFKTITYKRVSKAKDWYFKSGNYMQDKNSGAHSLVTIHKLKVSHS